MLACGKTVTLVRLNESGEGYNCSTIEGVSWHSKTQIEVKDRGVVAGNVVKVRIPAANLPEGLMPQTGDFLVLGEAKAITKQAELAGYVHAKVLGVGNNLRGGLPHVAVTCG